MTTATHTIPSYQQQAAVKKEKISKENEVIFVPTLVDLQTPVKKRSQNLPASSSDKCVFGRSNQWGGRLSVENADVICPLVGKHPED